MIFINITLLESYGLQGPESFLYTSKSNCLDVPGIDDIQDFQETLVKKKKIRQLLLKIDKLTLWSRMQWVLLVYKNMNKMKFLRH